MARQKNLKTRMRKVIYTCIAMTILLFFVVLSFASLEAERQKGALLTSMISHLVSVNVFSEETLTDGKNPDLNQIAEKVHQLESETLRTFVLSSDRGYSVSVPENYDIKNVPQLKTLVAHPLTKEYYRLGEVTQIKIEVRGQEVYISQEFGRTKLLERHKGKIIYPIVSLLSGQLDCESRYIIGLAGTKGQQTNTPSETAVVTVRLDPTFLVSYFLFLRAGSLLVIAIGFLLISLIGRFLSVRISKPFSLLEARVKALAMEDYETTLRSQIIVKKHPLAEISSIAESTNTLLKKMQAFDEMMMEQNNQLEAQNTDLENQREELLESRQIIQEAQSQLVQSQNLAAVGQLTAAISHEIDEPLDHIHKSINKQTSLLQGIENSPLILENQELKDLVTQLKDASALNNTALERISSIIKGLRSFSRQDLDEVEETLINESIQSVVLLTSNLWKRRIKIIEDYGELPAIPCNPGLINQVFMNMIVNGIHAIPDKGEITIKTRADSSFVLVSIADNGTGIPEEIIPHIFDTGFTTKKSGSGSGLGLSICKSIIEKHNGKIEVNSKVGVGTVFTVILPINRL